MGSVHVVDADKRPVRILVLRGGNFFSLLINVNTDFFNYYRLRLALLPAVNRARLVLNRDRLDFVGLILPRNSNKPSAHAIDIVSSSTKNLGPNQKIRGARERLSFLFPFDV